jgi:amino acid transporter
MKSGKLGLGSAVAVCVGLIVATSCLLSLGMGIGLSGKAFILPLFVVVILNAFIALSFAELHRLMPNVDGGVGQYSLVGMGPLASLISNVSAYVITMVLASSVEAAMCGMVLHEFIPAIPAPVIGITVLVVLTVINFFGVDIFSKVQNTAVFLLVGSLIAMGIISFFKLGTGTVITPEMQTAPSVSGIGGVMSLAAIAFWLFIGVEFIIPVAKDLKNARRDVLLSMIIALVLLFVVQAVLGCGMTNYVTLADLSGSAMPHMVFAEALLGSAGKIWMGIITLLAGISTLNTVLASSARIVLGMAEEGMMPKFFKIENKAKAPVFGLLLIAGADFLLIVTGFVNSGGLTNAILAASCFWLLSYIMTHTNVLILRKRYPNADRNKKLTLWGIPQIIGIFGNIYMIWNISADMKSRMAIYEVFGVLFAILIVYAFTWVIGVMKVKPFAPVSMDEINANAIEFEINEKEADTEIAI